jgi:hypothetical protein
MIMHRDNAKEGKVQCREVESFGWEDVQQVCRRVEGFSRISWRNESLEEKGVNHVVGGMNDPLGLTILG